MMIKNILNTFLIVIPIFLLIIIFSFVSSTLNKNTCSQQNPSCPENYLCNFNKEICVQGEKCSEQKPEVCITVYNPVCSNGKEYSNSCFACMKGINLYYKGSC